MSPKVIGGNESKGEEYIQGTDDKRFCSTLRDCDLLESLGGCECFPLDTYTCRNIGQQGMLDHRWFVRHERGRAIEALRYPPFLDICFLSLVPMHSDSLGWIGWQDTLEDIQKDLKGSGVIDWRLSHNE